jgi:tRNA A37 methylthiotransferase MiaB
MGQTVKTLVEGPSKKSHQPGHSPQLIARTTGDWIVIFNGPENLAGQFTNVKITRTTPLTLFGELAGNLSA